MPHKHNADRRHHIAKMAFKVHNWPAYEAGLRRLGSLTLWIEPAGLRAGQWLEAKHGAKSRRKWRKLHLAVDPGSGMIGEQSLTDQDVDDPSQVAPLLDRIVGKIARVTADGAYDGDPTYRTVAAHVADIAVVIPPRSTSVARDAPDPPIQRDRHLEMIVEHRRLAWQASSGYGRRSLAESTMGRYKLAIVRPESVRRELAIA